MTPPRTRLRPAVESLEGRTAMASAVLAPIHPIPGEFPSANDHRPFTPADLQSYASAYLSSRGTDGYTPQYDFNGTGFIGQNDATPILRGLASITPRGPLTLSLALATGEQVKGHHPADSGGVTRLATVTVVGHTTPNSIVFIDGPTTSKYAQSTGNFKFEGGALATDSQGIFRYTVNLPANSRGGSLLGVNFLIRSPFNQQLIRSFPIRRLA